MFLRIVQSLICFHIKFCIIINSNWCGYSPDAKLYCREKSVGLFKIRDFMAALNLPHYWEYLTDYEKEKLAI